MKLLLLKVLIVTVLTVDSRLFPDEPEGKSLVEHASTADNERKMSNNGSYLLKLNTKHITPMMKTLTVHMPANTTEEPDYVMGSNLKMHHYKYAKSNAKAKTSKTLHAKMEKGNPFENAKFNTDANASRPLYAMKRKGTSRSTTSYRDDYRCGPDYLAPNGEPAGCPIRCCSQYGWCGDDEAAHCSCDRCTDYRVSWRNDHRCGADYLAPNGEPAICPSRCCSDHAWCSDTAEYCDCDGCADYRGSLYRGYVVQVAPKLRFDSKFGQDDYCFPSSANDYYFARLGGNTGRICNRDYSTMTSGNVPTYWKATPCGEDLVIAFWLWYGFQSGCLPGGNSGGVHDGDWEHVYVKINNYKTAPTLGDVQFYQHSGWYTRHFGSYEREGVHPIVYIGKVAHGSYHQDGGIGGCLYWEDYRKPGSQNMYMNTWLNIEELRRDASSPAFMNNVIHVDAEHPLDRGETKNMCSLKGCKGHLFWYTNGCYHSQVADDENY